MSVRHRDESFLGVSLPRFIIPEMIFSVPSRARKCRGAFVTHPATAMRKAGSPRRPDAELIPNLIRLLMPRPEVTAHPATAMRKAGGPRRPDAEQRRQVTRCSCRARRSRRSRPTQRRLNAQGRWSAASRRGTKRQVTRCSCRTRRSRPTQRRQSARQVVRGVPTRNKARQDHSLLMPRPEVAAHPAMAMRKAGGPRRPDAELSWQVTRCSCRARRSRPTQRRQWHGPSDGNAQSRWSAASRRGTKLAGHTRCSCRAPEVTAHPATAMRKAGGPRRPDAEQSWQVTRCSCRARRSRPTQRRQYARQVVRGVPTRNKVGRSLVAHAAPGGHGPPSDGNAQGRWSAASRRGTKTAGHSLLMPRPEVTAHPATAMRKAGGPRRPDAELIPTNKSTRLLMPRPEVTAHPAMAMRKAGGPRRPDAEL